DAQVATNGQWMIESGNYFAAFTDMNTGIRRAAAGVLPGIPNDLWGPVTPATGVAPALGCFGDARTWYDATSSRWFMTSLNWGAQSTCLFVSKSADPHGGWWSGLIRDNTATDFLRLTVLEDWIVSEDGFHPSPTILVDKHRAMAGDFGGRLS